MDEKQGIEIRFVTSEYMPGNLCILGYQAQLAIEAMSRQGEALAKENAKLKEELNAQNKPIPDRVETSQ